MIWRMKNIYFISQHSLTGRYTGKRLHIETIIEFLYIITINVIL